MPDLRSDALWKTSATRCSLAAALLAAIATAYRSGTSTDERAGAAPHRNDASPPLVTPPSEAARTLDLVCGASPGSLGPVFAGVELGQIVARLPDVPSRAGLGAIAVQTTGRRIDGVTVEVPADPGWAGCYQFSDQLHRRWGHPNETTAGSETWYDIARDQTASFTQFAGCALRFTRLVPVEQWLNDSRSSRIPIWAIGSPVAELEATLGLPAGDDPKALTWRDEALDLDLTAHLRHGRVVGIQVHPRFEAGAAEILWQRLKTLYGTPELTRAFEESLDVRWRHAPGIAVGKYWGHDGDVRMACHAPRACRDPRAGRTPRPPTANDGLLTSIVFGS